MRTPTKFITSDTHFSHRREFIWQKRGFSSWEEHDEMLILNWNNKVKPNDMVYHLGDVCFQPETQIDKILPRLNGRKILIMGNHDTNKKLFQYFEKIVSVYEHKEFVLTHIPLHPSQLEFRWKNSYNLHGHIHLNFENDNEFDLGERYFNVNIEFHNNKILSLEEVRELIKERKNK